jgi:hypothetical protein
MPTLPQSGTIFLDIYTFMNAELTERLYNDFPQLYLGRTKSTAESSMSWGFQCDDGWYELIRCLSLQLTNYANSHPNAVVEVAQVKEKFGWLRFHLIEDDDATLEMIELVCVRSRTTCELTGQPGVLCVKDLAGRSRRPQFKVLCIAKAAELGFIPAKSKDVEVDPN